MSKTIAVVAGPTASGKTALGVMLAKSLGGEVVSADSMQIYRSMSIGTAKPTELEMDGVAHHMLDIIDPQESFSVARYVDAASACVDDILARGKVPVIVGGTGLYIESLIRGRDFPAAPADPLVRDSLSSEYERIGGAAFREKLAKIDPERAEKLADGDKRRLIRAMEVYEISGKTISAHDAETKLIKPRYDAKMIVLSYRDRADLYARIDRRVDIMMEAGLISEVKSLLAQNVPRDCTAMQAIGYKEIVRALDGFGSMETAVETIKRESRRYAKRQLTWFRRYTDALWIEWEKQPDFDSARRLSTEFFCNRV